MVDFSYGSFEDYQFYLEMEELEEEIEAENST
jgi:hypothetical protein